MYCETLQNMNMPIRSMPVAKNGAAANAGSMPIRFRINGVELPSSAASITILPTDIPTAAACDTCLPMT